MFRTAWAFGDIEKESSSYRELRNLVCMRWRMEKLVFPCVSLRADAGGQHLLGHGMKMEC